MNNRDFDYEHELIEMLMQYDTPSITNVVATFPNDPELCLGLYHPWKGKWYTDQSLKCMFPELGRRAGYVVTCVCGLPDPGYKRLSFTDMYKAIENSPKPVIVVIKQNFPDEIKKINGLLGGNMMAACKALGAVGVISDGPSRDVDEIRHMGIQYMLTGIAPGHGGIAVQAVNVPVEVCGMAVCQGDIVHMDENGAVKFPSKYLEDVLIRVKKLQEKETIIQQRIRQANTAEEIAKILYG